MAMLNANAYLFIYVILVVAHGFPRCKPNRIPNKTPEDKIIENKMSEDKVLENKMSENGKPDKMPDNLNRTLTLTSS